jgi:hypothetical protein
MTEVQFFEKVHQKYKDSNHLLEGDGGYRIKRGMAHVMSGYLEDLFALYVAQNVNRKDLEYFVDKVISIRFSEKDKAKSFKPDLAIIDNGVMTHYFDLKSNLGWNRNAENYMLDKDRFIEKLKGQSAWIRDKYDKSVSSIKISDTLKYNMVVVFGGNISSKQMDNNYKASNGLENVQLHVLHRKRKDEAHEAIDLKAFEAIQQSLEILIA